MSRFGIGFVCCEVVTLTRRSHLPRGEGEEAEQEQLSAFSIQLEPETQPVDVGAVMNSSKITFVSDRDGTFDLFVMDEDRSNQTNITRTEEWEEDHPRWSPDGTRIAYCDRRHGKGEIYLIDADGSRLERLTRNTAPDLRPHWSPDGRWIAFKSDRDGDTQVYMMKADGSDVRRLTNLEKGVGEVSWSPTGHQIVFTGHEDGRQQIYRIDVEAGTWSISPTALPMTSPPIGDR